jgi:peptide/nickel transport system permease protein
MASAVTLLGTAMLTFFLLNAVPGDVARVIAGAKATPEVIQEIHVKYHLDDPLWQRFGYYLGQLAQGNLGHSYVTDQPVAEAILTRLPTTAALSSLAVVMWVALAVPFGVLTARFRDSWFDRSVLVAATLTLSLPAFWLARMLQYWLGYKLGWFPIGFFRNFADLLLPAAALAILFVGYYARLIHTNMVEVLDSPHVRAARARGASETTVLFKHALRNAMIPVVTLIGLQAPVLIGGAVIMEQIFVIPGMGLLLLEAVSQRDYPIITGVFLIVGLAVVAINLLVDLSYGLLDPKVRYR